jgi:hypothetical protein
MDTTLLRLIFIQNVKKGKNQPTLVKSQNRTSNSILEVPWVIRGSNSFDFNFEKNR